MEFGKYFGGSIMTVEEFNNFLDSITESVISERAKINPGDRYSLKMAENIRKLISSIELLKIE